VKYTCQQASLARSEYFKQEGYAEGVIDSWPLSGWVDLNWLTWVYRDHEDRELCRVEFTDDEGNALVSFVDGESGKVTIPVP
jgi:hypothetical protein